MPKSAPLQSSFLGGEFSIFSQGRVDLPIYKTGMNKIENYIPTIQGSLTRRSGTAYIAPIKNQLADARLIKFELSSTISFAIELGAGYFRFFSGGEQVLLSGVPYEVANIYPADVIADIRVVQNQKTLYIFHPLYRPAQLVYNSNASWTFTSGLTFSDGPYLPENTTATTLTVTPDGFTSPCTITASSTTGINGGQGFLPGDVLRTIRTQNVLETTLTGGTVTSTYPNGQSSTTDVASGGVITLNQHTWFTIITVNSPTEVICFKGGVNFNNQPGTKWQLGLFCDFEGYPSNGTIHEGRLFLAGVPGHPRRLDASVSNDYQNFAPTDYQGIVADSNALSFTLASRDQSPIVWMEADEKGLLVGSQGDEWTFRPSLLSGATSPTNVDAKPVTFFGSAAIAPVKIGKSILFVQRYKRILREMGFYFDVNGYRSPNRTKIAEHILGDDGIVEMAHQREPQSIVWCVRVDGQVAAMTHESEDGVITTGWHRHILGGFSDGGGTPAQVKSVCCIPSGDGSRDDVYFIVRRLINGFETQYVEIMQPIFSNFTIQRRSWYVDSGISYDGSPTTTITGLGHLDGQTVVVLGDGAPMGDFVVSGGQITLPYAVSVAQVGLPFTSRGQLLRLESGAANGTALGKIRRTHRIGIYLEKTLGISIGTDFDNMTPLEFRTANMPIEQAIPFYSGIRLETIDADYNFDNEICFEQAGPTPGNILAILPRMDTQDGE